MRLVVSFLAIGWMYFSSSCFLTAQIAQAVIPLQLEGEPRPTQVPPYSNISSPQCDHSGDIYLHYSVDSGNLLSSTLATIEPDASTQTISLSPATSSPNENHVFLFSPGSDGSLHEILRVRDFSDQEQSSSDVVYATFDSDGELRTNSRFSDEFIPSLLLPLPNGSFFASGVSLKDTRDEVTETPVVGIFNADAKLVRHLRKDPGAFADGSGKNVDDQDSDSNFDGGIARLGSDGNIYVLLLGNHAKVAVVNQAGQITREMNLQEPSENDVAHDIWTSGNRILIVYEGEANDPKDSHIYVVYDAQTGEIIRVYRPEFTGTVACFQDGQTVSVLVQQPASGKISLATAELQ